MNRKHYPLTPKTIYRLSASQVSVFSLPERRQLQIALEVAEQGMLLAYASDLGDLWVKCWKRAEEVRGQLKQL